MSKNHSNQQNQNQKPQNNQQDAPKADYYQRGVTPVFALEHIQGVDVNGDNVVIEMPRVVVIDRREAVIVAAQNVENIRTENPAENPDIVAARKQVDTLQAAVDAGAPVEEPLKAAQIELSNLEHRASKAIDEHAANVAMAKSEFMDALNMGAKLELNYVRGIYEIELSEHDLGFDPPRRLELMVFDIDNLFGELGGSSEEAGNGFFINQQFRAMRALGTQDDSQGFCRTLSDGRNLVLLAVHDKEKASLAQRFVISDFSEFGPTFNMMVRADKHGLRYRFSVPSGQHTGTLPKPGTQSSGEEAGDGIMAAAFKKANILTPDQPANATDETAEEVTEVTESTEVEDAPAEATDETETADVTEEEVPVTSETGDADAKPKRKRAKKQTA